MSLPALQVLETHGKFWNTWRNSLKQAETDRNLQIFTDTHNNSKLNMNIQSWTFAYVRLLNKPYVNWVSLRQQKQP